MNERIKELLKQSKLHPYYYAQEAQIDMFAELLVRECAEICLEANDHKNILRHFGIEE